MTHSISVKNRIGYIALIIMIVIISALSGRIIPPAFADSGNTTAFDKTDVMDDLKSSPEFDILHYPYDSTGIIKHPEILTFVEYCYSFRQGKQDNYGLYIYFYNPQALNISTASGANKITLATAWETTDDGNLRPTEYEKYELMFCSKSTGDYRDLFYKFKVIDRRSASDGKTIVQRVNSNARRYDISEVELLTYGNRNATAYRIGGSYTFAGYAKGYGADENAVSTLSCSRADLETIMLDLSGIIDGVDKRTYWRSNSVSALGKGNQNQINSVFFAVDTNILEKYGYTLQRIKAEWWEYKTRPAVVLENKSVYDELYTNHVGVSTVDVDYSNISSLYPIPCIQAYKSWSADDAIMNSYYSWRMPTGKIFYKPANCNYQYNTDYNETLLPLLFYSNGISVNDFTLSAETLQSYCENYNKSFENGHITFNEHYFSADLFLDVVDNGRTYGYNCREFDISNPDDYYNLKSYDSSHNWWDKLCDFGFGSINTSAEYKDVPPIEEITEAHISSSNIADLLKINPDDVSRIKDYYNESTADNDKDGKPDQHVFIFRYAFVDYYAMPCTAYTSAATCDGEVRQGTQIFDFDILTMTFNKDNVYTTLGVVSSPIDHWTGYTPAIKPTTPDWWKWVKIALIILAVMLVFLLLYPILFPALKAVVNGVVWVITAPFKAIGKAVKKRKNKKD